MLVVVGALALVVVLVGPRLVGALPDAALSELKEDPLATYEPPGGELVDTHEQKPTGRTSSACRSMLSTRESSSYRGSKPAP